MADNLPLQYEENLGPGVDIVFTDASANGHEFSNDGSVAIWIENNRGSTVTVTVPSAKDSNFGPYPAKEFEVGASRVRSTPTWNPRRFSDAATRLLTFTLSETTNVKVAAVVRHQYYEDD